MKLFLNSIIVFLLSFMYASMFWLNRDAGIMDRIASVNEVKPYVYRQLIPMLARFLSEFGIRIDWSLCILVALCGLGFYLSTRAIVLCFNNTLSNLEELSIFGLCVMGLGILGNHRWNYDLATAFLFSLSTLFIVRGELVKYLCVFPVAVLNRETSILLVGIFVIYFGWKYMEIFYQFCAFGSIQLMLRLVFWNNLGEDVLIEPMENISKFLSNPERTVQHLLIFSILLVMSVYGWNRKSNLKWGFAGLLSVLCVMYVVMGQAFEVRVFWEVYPLVVVLSTQTIKEIYHEKIQTTKNQKVHGLQPTQNSFPQ